MKIDYSIKYKQLVRFKENREPSLKSHLLLLMIGIGHLLDGIILLVSLGFVTGGFTLEAARQLALHRFAILQSKGDS